MNVFVLTINWDYEGAQVMDVCASFEAAKKVAANYTKNSSHYTQTTDEGWVEASERDDLWMHGISTGTWLHIEEWTVTE